MTTAEVTEDCVVLSARNLGMTYRAPVREAGLRAALRSVVHREHREIEAVAELSFDLRAGEVVGFIGPNGAGKTTTLKILSGVLHPTSGEARVLGFVPWRRQRDYLKRIALVRGSQPISGPAELTVMDSLRYQQVLYEVPRSDFDSTIDELVDLLELASLLDRQVRALSLGERMRAGLATTMVYRPKVLFLDEPTLGLDVSAAATFRRFIANYATRTGATVLLTSHYMADVEALCRRVILIDRSRVRYDGELGSLAAKLSPGRLIDENPPLELVLDRFYRDAER
ncbi:MAG: viologen exporter family transport system ATP-binding protein [Kribbellaceae bacterium]|nr:viologen exporter family transport system ATP-binding protein [Kribbellaceae bacterium]